MLIFGYVLCGIAALIAVPLLTFSIYMLTALLGSAIPRRIKYQKSASAKIAILIRAHNAEKNIEKTVTSLIAEVDYPGNMYEPIVIADNCSDSTSYLASFAGARVFDRTNEWKAGKWHAVEWALDKIKKEKFDIFLILDPGSTLKKNSLRYLDAEFSEGHIAMQLKIDSGKQKESWMEALRHGLNAHQEYMLPKGRERIGFSAPLTGNGTAFSKTLFDQIPFDIADSGGIYEYHCRLVTAGEKARFITGKDAGILLANGGDISDSPDEKHLKKFMAKLTKATFHGNCTALESLINLFLPPPGTMLLSYVVLCFAGVMLFLAADLPGCEMLLRCGIAILIFSMTGILTLHLYVFTGMLERKVPLKSWLAVLLWPVVITGNILTGKQK